MRSIVIDSIAWSVGLSVTLLSPAKTAEPMETPFGLSVRTGPRNHKLDEPGPDPPWEGAILGEGAPIVKYRSFCREMCKNGWTDRFATWVVNSDRRKHKFNRIRQVAQMCQMGGHIGVTWRIWLNHSSVAAMRSYVKLLRPLVHFTTDIWHTQSCIIIQYYQLTVKHTLYYQLTGHEAQLSQRSFDAPCRKNVV